MVRAAEAERLEFPDGSSMTLLADSHATDAKLSVHHTVLPAGAAGASPHHHTTAAEVFYVLRGTVQLLVGDDVVLAGPGDLAVVPPGVSHAFAAAPGTEAELLVAITPGIQRFELFRRLGRALAGLEPRGSVFDDQSEYDTYNDDSPVWARTRTLASTKTSKEEIQ